MATEPSFAVELTADVDLGETLLVGIADVGVAGLTAVDYFTNHGDVSQIGHLTTRNLPDITPFSEGVPRHPIRLYGGPTSDLTVLVSEVFLPVWVADPLTTALFDWLAPTTIEEIVVLYGAPFPHAEQEHVVFAVGTDAFRERRVADGDIPPLAGGFFDGVVAELMTRGLDVESPAVGALVTPAHFPGPDLEGALRLLEALESVYDVEIDEGELRDRSETMRQHYQELAERMETLRDGEQPLRSRDVPEDRMYM